MSSRVVGYYISINGKVDDSTKYLTQNKAFTTATTMLPSLSRKSKKKKVLGIVRANDKVLLMTVTLGRKGLQIEKK